MCIDTYLCAAPSIMKLDSALNSLERDNDNLNMASIYTDWEGITLTTISAFISTFASFLVINLILKSEKGLPNSVHHRIFFGMSVADIFQSIPMALTTIPMPTDMMFRDSYKGIIIGNNISCNIQAYLIYCGAVSSMVYNASLSVYYLCSINRNTPDDEFRKYIEPYLHILSILPAMITPVFGITLGEFHPDPKGATWCQFSVYPWQCKTQGCIETGDPWLPQDYFLAMIFSVSPLIVIICMILIVLKVRREELQLEKLQMEESDHDDDEDEWQEKARLFNNTKIISKQALAYSCVSLLNFVTIMIFPLINFYGKDSALPTWMHIAFLVLRPIQGLLNSIIFVGHKAHNLRRKISSLSQFAAIKLALQGYEEDDQVISGLRNVMIDSELENVHLATVRNGEVVQVYDEFVHMRRRGPEDYRYSTISETSPLIMTTPDPSMDQSVQNISGFSGTGLRTMSSSVAFETIDKKNDSIK